jgi:hypothetical protein
MTAMPLVVIPEPRRARELRRALQVARAERRDRRRVLVPGLLCGAWVFLGCLLVGLGFHLTDTDRAEAAFLAGILVGNGGPMWTLIVWQWRAERR